jgi:hypothetical protein
MGQEADSTRGPGESIIRTLLGTEFPVLLLMPTPEEPGNSKDTHKAAYRQY